MSIASLLLFAGALMVAAASPGPAVVAIVARVLGRGMAQTAPFAAGIAVGDVGWLTLAVGGLAVLAKSFALLFLLIRYAGAAYLLYLAWRLWRTPADRIEVTANDRAEHPARLFGAGLALTMGNPKAMMFYMALLPTFIDLEQVTFAGYLALACVALFDLAIVFGGYMLAAGQARRIFTRPAAVRMLNRTTGAIMAGAALAIAAK